MTITAKTLISLKIPYSIYFRMIIYIYIYRDIHIHTDLKVHRFRHQQGLKTWPRPQFGKGLSDPLSASGWIWRWAASQGITGICTIYMYIIHIRIYTYIYISIIQKTCTILASIYLYINTNHSIYHHNNCKM